jgi:hypothetical protein
MVYHPKGQVIDTSGMDLDALDRKYLDERGRIKLLPAECFAVVPWIRLRAWLHYRCAYGVPTVELVNWLTEQIGGRKAIEIGAGTGNLGYRLGIPMTDSYQQVEDVNTVAFFATHGQPLIKPPPEVEKEEAENAVRRRRPQVVIASWLTERHDPKDPFSKGNYLGPRYEYIIDRCETFILIGNEATHGRNRALKLPHEKFAFPWLVSRAARPDLNRIWIWSSGRTGTMKTKPK